MSDDKDIDEDDLEIVDDIDIEDVDVGDAEALEGGEETAPADIAAPPAVAEAEDAELSLDFEEEEDFDFDEDEDVPAKSSSLGKLIFWLVILGGIGGGGWYGYQMFTGTEMGRQLAGQAQQAVQTAMQQPAQEVPVDSPSPASEDLPLPGDPAVDVAAAPLPAELPIDVPAETVPDLGGELMTDDDLDAALEGFDLTGDVEEIVETVDTAVADVPENSADNLGIPPMMTEDIPVIDAVPPEIPEDSGTDMAGVDEASDPAPAVAPIPDPVFEAVVDVPLADPVPDIVAEQNPEPAPVVTEQNQVPTPTMNEDNLVSRLERIIAQGMEKITDKVSEIEAAVSGLEAVTADQVTRRDLGVIERSIQALEDKVARLEREGVRSNRPVASTPATSSVQAPKLLSAPVVTRRVPVKAKKPSWVLRSVVGKTAWISEQDKVGMRKVTVGDVVPGLGTIQTISREGGAWVVQADQGRIRP